MEKRKEKAMSKHLILSLFLVALIPCMGVAQSRKLNPVDEAPKDPSFKAFRDKLIAAMKNEDEMVLYGSIDPKITNSFGGEGGVTEFNIKWKMSDDHPKVYAELAKILSMGGSFSVTGGEKSFCAPYAYSNFPEDLDANAYAVITGTSVRVRAQPNLNAPILTALSYDIVELNFEPPVPDENSEWVKINAPNGKKGYVFGQYIRRPIDHRACFAKKQGKWLMTALVAGD
jgi:hypothetical protein